jgi:hypothetical protein
MYVSVHGGLIGITARTGELAYSEFYGSTIFTNGACLRNTPGGTALWLDPSLDRVSAAMLSSRCTYLMS